jgi:hypothetical protein
LKRNGRHPLSRFLRLSECRARELGLDRAFYPVEDGFREIGISPAFGWHLVKRGDLSVTRLAKRKTIVAAVDLARFVWHRRQAPPEPRVSVKK